MNCQDVEELLIPYLDGELTKEAKEVIELHLSACPLCRRELESLSATQDQLRQRFQTVADKTPSVQAWTRLQQRLAAGDQPRVAVFNLAKSKLRSGVNVVKRGLVSQQPAWKPALAGALVVALIIGIALILPPHLGQPQEVLAAEIAQDDPQVQELLPEGIAAGITKVVKPQEAGIFHVVFLIPGESIWGEEGEGEVIVVNALVNVHERKVIGLRAIRTVGIPIMPLSPAEKGKAIKIAKADTEVQEILASGAEIHRVIPFPFSQPPDSSLTVKVVGVVLITPLLDSQAKGAPELGSQRRIVVVDLDEGRVVRLMKTTP